MFTIVMLNYFLLLASSAPGTPSKISSGGRNISITWQTPTHSNGIISTFKVSEFIYKSLLYYYASIMYCYVSIM